VNVGGEVAYCGPDALVEGTSEGEVPPEAHAGSSDAAIARLEAHEAVDAERGVFIVGRDLLRDFPLVALVGAGVVIG